MADLRGLLTGAGYVEVRTHLQSGNILLTSGASPGSLQRELEELISATFGFRVQVVVRTRDELAGVIARNPLADVEVDPKRYQVSFLAAELDPARRAELEAVGDEPERVAVIGREIYAWHPTGIHDSQLAKLLSEKRLGVSSTARNWSTVTKLLALADE